MAENNRIRVPTRVPSVLDLHCGAATRLDVFGFVGDGIAEPADRRPTDERLLLCARSDRLNSQAMREQGVMSRKQDFVQAELHARGVLADGMPEVEKALRFIQGDPMVDAVGKPIHDHLHVVGEPSRTVRVQPASAEEKLVRVIPVEKRHPRFDALRQQFIDQPVIKAEPLAVDGACAFRKHARPGNGKAIRVDADLAHQVDVFLVAMVVVAGDVACVPFPDFSGLPRTACPRRKVLSGLRSTRLRFDTRPLQRPT